MTGNIQQQVFDAIAAGPGVVSVEQIAQRLRFDSYTIERAIKRLRQRRCLISWCIDGVWSYTTRANARPNDLRGKWARK